MAARPKSYDEMLIEVTFSPYPYIWWSQNWTGNTLFGYNTLVNVMASGSTRPGDHLAALQPPSGDQSPGGDARFSGGGASAKNKCIGAIKDQALRLLRREKSHPIVGARSSVKCIDLVSGSQRMERNSCGNLEYIPVTPEKLRELPNDVARATWAVYPEMEMDMASTEEQIIYYTDSDGEEQVSTVIPPIKVNNAIFTIYAGSLNTQQPPDNYHRRIPEVYETSRSDENALWQQGHHITNIKIKYKGKTWNSNGGWGGTKSDGKKHLIQLQHISTDVMKNDGTYQPYHCSCNLTGTAVLDIEVFRTRFDDRGNEKLQLDTDTVFKPFQRSMYRPIGLDPEREIDWPMPSPWRTLCWEQDWESPTDDHLDLSDIEALRTYNSCAAADFIDVSIAIRTNTGCDFLIDASETSVQEPGVSAGPATLTRRYKCEGRVEEGGEVYDEGTYTAKWGPVGTGWNAADFDRVETVCDPGLDVMAWLGEGTNPFDPATIPHNEMWNKLNGKAFDESVQILTTTNKSSYRWFNSEAYSQTVLDVRSMMSRPVSDGIYRRDGNLTYRRIRYAIGLPKVWDQEGNADMVVPIQANWLEVTATLEFWNRQQELYPSVYYPPPSIEAAYSGVGLINIKPRSWQYDGGGKTDSGWIDLPAPNLAAVTGIGATNAGARIFTVQTRVVNLTYDRIGNYCPNGVGEKPDQSSIKDSDIETRIPDNIPGSKQKGTQTSFNQPKESTYDRISEYYTDRSDKPGGDEPNYPNSSFAYYSNEDLETHFPPQNTGETYESYRDTDGAVADSSKTLKPKLRV